jgi:hypothetical protein
MKFAASAFARSCAALIVFVPFAPAAANDSSVAISCRIENSVESESRVSGEVTVEVINLSSGVLNNVLVRFAPQSGGTIAGETSVAVQLAPGGVGVLSASFSLPVSTVNDQEPLFWEVRYDDGASRSIEVASDSCSY